MFKKDVNGNLLAEVIDYPTYKQTRIASILDVTKSGVINVVKNHDDFKVRTHGFKISRLNLIKTDDSKVSLSDAIARNYIGFDKNRVVEINNEVKDAVKDVQPNLDLKPADDKKDYDVVEEVVTKTISKTIKTKLGDEFKVNVVFVNNKYKSHDCNGSYCNPQTLVGLARAKALFEFIEEVEARL